jgi:hypothetical protein
MNNTAPTSDPIREYVRERDGAIATNADAGASAGCCDGAPQSDATACAVADEESTSNAAGKSGCGAGSLRR